MRSLKSLWEDQTISHPFIAVNSSGVLFLCRELDHNDYFYGQRLEVSSVEGQFNVVSTSVFKGTLVDWELL